MNLLKRNEIHLQEIFSHAGPYGKGCAKIVQRDPSYGRWENQANQQRILLERNRRASNDDVRERLVCNKTCCSRASIGKRIIIFTHLCFIYCLIG